MADRVVCIPVDLLATPREGDVLLDRWWVTSAGGALFWQRLGSRGWSPQCNTDRRLPDRLVKDLYPGADVTFIPIAYLGRHDDYWGHVFDDVLLGAATNFERPTPLEGETHGVG